jgi:Capsular polysaccharide synthesis protein
MEPPSLRTAKNGQQPITASSSSRARKNGARRRLRWCNFRGMLLVSLLVTMLIGIYNNFKLFCAASNKCLLENIGTYFPSSSLIISSLLVAMQQPQAPISSPPPPTNIPRTIFLFWESGFPSAKLEVQMIYQSWAFFNPTFTIKTLNGTEADLLSDRRRFIPDDVWSNTTVQARSDVYRVLLLYQHGGVWVDASLFCNQALDAWLDLNSTELVAFRRTDNLREQKLKDINPWISSWFLASPKGSYILSKVINVISDPEQYYRFQKFEYFWLHRIVAQIAHNEENVMAHITNYSSPIHCSDTGWRMRAPVLKRCANHYMYHMLATHQRCCSSASNNQTTTTALMTTARDWGDICAQWNCSMVSANLPLKDKITRLYGGSKRLGMLKSVWYKDMELPPLPDPLPTSWNKKKVTKSAVKKSTGAAAAAAAAAAVGHSKIRHAPVKASTPSKIPRTIFILSESGWPSTNARTNLIRRSFEIANPTFTRQRD